MRGYVFDIAFLLIFVSTAFFVSRKLIVDAALAFLTLLVSSLFAITTFEPIAEWMRQTLFSPSDIAVTIYLWFTVLMVMFFLSAFGIAWCMQIVLPKPPELTGRVDAIGSWGLGLLSGYLLGAFLLTAIQTWPAPRDLWGCLAPEAHRRSGLIVRMAPDYQYLNVVDYTCGRAVAVTGADWTLDGPVFSPGLKKGRWESFPVRYAVWRELRYELRQRRNE